MTVLVTGATGFIGHRVAERLLAAGRAVRCAVRSPEKARDLAEMGAEVVPFDLATGRGVEEAARGAEAAVHLAGVVRAWRRADYFETNEGGARRIAGAARAAGARRLVLVSSLAALGPSRPGRPVEEDDEPRPLNAYGASKLAGERAFAEAAGPIGGSIVRPCAVYGPRDRDFLVLFRMAARLRWIPYAARPGAELSLIHVEDLVDLILAALDRAPPGRAYLAADGSAHRWDEVIRAIGRSLGREVRPFRIPPRLLWPIAAASVLLRLFAPRPPLFSPDKLREAIEGSWVASPERARRELGWEPRVGLEEGARGTAAWYRENAWL